MAARRFPVLLCILAKLISPTSLEGRQLSDPEASHARDDASKLFQQHCARCHGADGTGSRLRGRQPEIPDFTQASWQARRSDAQLQASILEGMGAHMPAWRGKVSEKQARDLAAYIRALAPTNGTPTSAPPASADERFQSLQKELRTLQEQFHELSKDSPVDPPTTPPEPPRPKASSPAVAPKAGKGLDPAENPNPKDSRPPVAPAEKTPAVSARPEREAILSEPPDAQPPMCFVGKLIRWLGKLHPAAIHFPIALLTAAAAAEVLRLLTGNPVFDAVSRYCIWFGTLGAVVAGALGWFAAGFQLTDASWVMTTHRWLGTFVVA
ncbi:MAG TPA: c-type cytochrome, partial [Gemmataceae bacterium]|nr:c-type cytochrome [Gemmataceae bacterium]